MELRGSDMAQKLRHDLLASALQRLRCERPLWCPQGQHPQDLENRLSPFSTKPLLAMMVWSLAFTHATVMPTNSVADHLNHGTDP